MIVTLGGNLVGRRPHCPPPSEFARAEFQKIPLVLESWSSALQNQFRYMRYGIVVVVAAVIASYLLQNGRTGGARQLINRLLTAGEDPPSVILDSWWNRDYAKSGCQGDACETIVSEVQDFEDAIATNLAIDLFDLHGTEAQLHTVREQSRPWNERATGRFFWTGTWGQPSKIGPLCATSLRR